MFPAGNEVAQPAVPAGLTLAPIGRRVAGLILDQLIIAFPAVIVVLALGYTPSDNLTSRSVLTFSVCLTALAFVYYTTLIALLGRTFGKMALGTRVVRLIDGRRPDYGDDSDFFDSANYLFDGHRVLLSLSLIVRCERFATSWLAGLPPVSP